MPYDNRLADRIRAVLTSDGVEAREQPMFGGLSFLVADRFAVGLMKEDVVLRIGEVAAREALQRPGVRPMDFTGRPMNGWIYVAASAVDDDAALTDWVRTGVAYSATQQPSRKSRKGSQAAAVHPRQQPGMRRT